MSGTVALADGETTRLVSIPILEDSLPESDEQFSFTIDNVKGGAVLLVPRTATITIDDNDSIQSAGDGLLGEYFDNIDLTTLFINRVDPAVNFNWGSGAPATGMGFSVRWSGQVEAIFDETYTFQTVTDDGVRLWVDDQLLIDDWNNHPAITRTGSITLVGGQLYDIKMEYFENGGLASSTLSWSSPSQSLEIIPQSQLYAADPPLLDPGNSLVAQTILSGITTPTAIDFSPDGQNIYVAEKGGIVRVRRNGLLQTTPFIDISAEVNNIADRRLLDIAVHPAFVNNPYVYLLYTYDPPEVFQNAGDGLAGPDRGGNRAGRTIRVTADVNTNYTTAVAGSEVVLLSTNSTWDNFNAFVDSTSNFTEPPAGILPDGTNVQDFVASDSLSHTIGNLNFAPDGALLVSVGDGASFNQVDPRAVRVQDIDNLSGKILRIDPLTGEGLADNPFFIVPTPTRIARRSINMVCATRSASPPTPLASSTSAMLVGPSGKRSTRPHRERTLVGRTTKVAAARVYRPAATAVCRRPRRSTPVAKLSCQPSTR